jgi:hypothetical protein
MKKYYKAQIEYTYELDLYNEGCQPNTYTSHGIVHTAVSDTLEGIVNLVKEFTGGEEVYRFDDRLMVQTMVNSDSYQPSAREIELWKQGEVKLYAATYNIYVDEVIETDFNTNEAFSFLEEC